MATPGNRRDHRLQRRLEDESRPSFRLAEAEGQDVGAPAGNVAVVGVRVQPSTIVASIRNRPVLGPDDLEAWRDGRIHATQGAGGLDR
jgi:hypothetical protein